MRLFISQPLNANSLINLSADLVHRLYNVLRLQTNDMITVFNHNVDGIEFSAKIREINKKTCVLEILEQRCGIAESPIQIELVQGIARGEKMDYIIQKAIELGVYEIVPIFTDFCNVKLSGERLQQRLDHWQKIVIHACEQSGRCFIPQINNAMNIKDWLEQKIDKSNENNKINETSENPCNCKILLSPRSTVNLTQFLVENKFSLDNPVNKTRKLSIVIGAEGGISPDEELLAQQFNIQLCYLGKRILRTETASVVALSLIQGLYGDL